MASVPLNRTHINRTCSNGNLISQGIQVPNWALVTIVKIIIFTNSNVQIYKPILKIKKYLKLRVQFFLIKL
jgi:hypothetical protein